MKAFVTGAHGFCGRHLMTYLRSQGVDALAISEKEGSDLQFALDDASAWKKALDTERPDFIFHLAGTARSPDRAVMYRVNAGYAAALLQALDELSYPEDRPVLLVGTAAEYGLIRPEQNPVPESAPLHPCSDYGISKMAQTQMGLVAAQRRAVVIARPFNILGPGLSPSLSIGHFALSIASAAAKGGPGYVETGNLDSSRDFIHVADVVELYWKLVREPRARGQVVNVCSGRPVRISDALDILIRASESRVEVRIDPARFKPLDVPVCYGDTRKLESLQGPLRLRPLESALKETLESYLKG